jgi:predicted RNA-binding Zn ribbon-like protein
MEIELAQLGGNAGALELVGGELCLDFVKTVGNHNCPHPNEHLTDYRALVVWSRHARIASPSTAQRLLRQAACQPAEAKRVLSRAIELREALYNVFSVVAQGNRPKAGDLQVLNRNLTQALAHERVVQDGDGFRWEWEAPEEALDQMLWPVARSAADLLTSDKLARVRECDGETCGWLFVDISKNHSRRWCSMNDCGNRAKAQRYHQRQCTPA